MNYEIIKIFKDDENLDQYNKYGDMLKRQSKRKNAESETSCKKQKITEFEDDILFCFECNDECVGECTNHQSQWILNKRVNCTHTALRANEMFNDYYNENIEESECYCKMNAIKHIKSTLPSGFFLVKSQIENTTYGVWTKNNIARGTILGPFLGKLTRENNIGNVSCSEIEDGIKDFIWQLIPTNNVGSYNLIDARDCMIANYLRFVRRARNTEEQNLISFQFDGKIFYQALKNIESNDELLVSYIVRNFNPPHSQKLISIRMIPSSSQHPINKATSNISKSAVINSESSYSKDESESDSSGSPSYPSSDSTPTAPRPSTTGAKIKVDEEMKDFVKKLFLKYPVLSGVEANKALQKAMTHKPTISNRTMLSIIKKNNFRPVLSADAILDKQRLHTIVDMYKNNPDLSNRDIKSKIEDMYPDKPSISYSTIDKILDLNRLRNYSSAKQKFSREMLTFLTKLLKNDPTMLSQQLNNALQKEFPDCPKISNDYVNQIVTKHRLRSIPNPRRKLDENMRKFVCDLYFKDNVKCREICDILNKKYPEIAPISKRCVNRVISLHKGTFKADDVSF